MSAPRAPGARWLPSLVWPWSRRMAGCLPGGAAGRRPRRSGTVVIPARPPSGRRPCVAAEDGRLDRDPHRRLAAPAGRARTGRRRTGWGPARLHAGAHPALRAVHRRRPAGAGAADVPAHVRRLLPAHREHRRRRPAPRCTCPPPAASDLRLASGAQRLRHHRLLRRRARASWARRVRRPTITSWDRGQRASPTGVTDDGRAYVRADRRPVRASLRRSPDLGFWSGRTGGLALTGTDRPNTGAIDASADDDATRRGGVTVAARGALTASAGPRSAVRRPAGPDAGTPCPRSTTCRAAITRRHGRRQRVRAVRLGRQRRPDRHDSSITSNPLGGVVLHRYVTNGVDQPTDSSDNAATASRSPGRRPASRSARSTPNDNGGNGFSLSGGHWPRARARPGPRCDSYGNNSVTNSSRRQRPLRHRGGRRLQRRCAEQPGRRPRHGHRRPRGRPKTVSCRQHGRRTPTGTASRCVTASRAATVTGNVVDGARPASTCATPPPRSTATPCRAPIARRLTGRRRRGTDVAQRARRQRAERAGPERRARTSTAPVEQRPQRLARHDAWFLVLKKLLHPMTAAVDRSSAMLIVLLALCTARGHGAQIEHPYAHQLACSERRRRAEPRARRTDPTVHDARRGGAPSVTARVAARAAWCVVAPLAALVSGRDRRSRRVVVAVLAPVPASPRRSPPLAQRHRRPSGAGDPRTRTSRRAEEDEDGEPAEATRAADAAARGTRPAPTPSSRSSAPTATIDRHRRRGAAGRRSTRPSPATASRSPTARTSASSCATQSGTRPSRSSCAARVGAVLDGDEHQGRLRAAPRRRAALAAASASRSQRAEGRRGRRHVGSVIQGLTVTDIGDEAIHLRSPAPTTSCSTTRSATPGCGATSSARASTSARRSSNWGTYTDWRARPQRLQPRAGQHHQRRRPRRRSTSRKARPAERVIDNTFDGSGMTGADSWVDVKGNDWLIEGNTGTQRAEDGFQTHQILDGWGDNNVFIDNNAEGGLASTSTSWPERPTSSVQRPASATSDVNLHST